MCIFIIALILSMVQPLVLHAQAEQICAQGNALYFKKEFARAQALYESIEQKNSAIWYNLGNCYYKQVNIMQALLCWHRALKNANNQLSTDCAYNITVAEQKLGITPEEQQSLRERITKNLTAIPLLLHQLFFLILWLLLIFYFIKNAGRGKKYKFVLASSGIIMALLLSLAMMYYHTTTMRHALVMRDNVVIFAGPDEKFHQRATMQKAAIITVQENRGTWAKVRYKGHVGWVMTESIENI